MVTAQEPHNPADDDDDLFADFTLFFSQSDIDHIKQVRQNATRNKSLDPKAWRPKILVVEDQDFSRKLLMEMLARDHTCFGAATVQQAVTLYAEHVPDIVFLDIELPDVNGHDFAKFVRKHDPQSYIVMLTANHTKNDVLRARDNAVRGYIAKPYSKQKILQAIEAFIKR